MTDYLDLQRDEVEPFVPAGSRSILDVGCWRGRFGQMVKSRRPGVEVWGLDSDADAISVARGRLDGVIHGSYPEDVPRRRFDCVVFNDVLEHLADPWTALGSAGPLLEEGGSVVASIPNIRHYSVLRDLALRGRWTYTDTGLLDRTHLRFFTRASIEDLFDSAGFVVNRLEAVNEHTDDRLGVVLRGILRGRRRDLLNLQFVVVAKPSQNRCPR